MPEVYCKGDCTFADNESRLCKLELIELVQRGEGMTEFTCAQYVKTDKLANRHKETDLDRARTAGVWDVLKRRLR